MEKSFEASNDRIPTYEESVLSGGASSESMSKEIEQDSQSLPLQQQLAKVRTNRIRNVVGTYIRPLLEVHAFSGLLKTTIVLVPSNAQSLQASSTSGNDVIEGSGDAISHNSTESVIGFPDEDYVKLVRLHGEENNTEFWRQLVVIKELENTLKASLMTSGHETSETDIPQPTSKPIVTLPAAEQSRKRSFFSRRSQTDSSSGSAPISQSDDTPTRAAPEKALSPGHIRVGVGLEEVVLRVVTSMGLYDTKTGKAVVVRMEIGS